MRKIDSDVMTLPEVAAWLRVKATTIYKWVGLGGLPFFRVGSQLRFRRGSLDKWIEKQVEERRCSCK